VLLTTKDDGSGPGLSEEDIRNQILLFFVAGTSPYSLSLFRFL
jgi:cytochrome P450